MMALPLLCLLPTQALHVRAKIETDPTDVEINSFLPKGWTFSGCYDDEGETRQLTNITISGADVTMESCINYCADGKMLP
jgi:hypothetical protein